MSWRSVVEEVVRRLALVWKFHSEMAKSEKWTLGSGSSNVARAEPEIGQKALFASAFQ